MNYQNGSQKSKTKRPPTQNKPENGARITQQKERRITIQLQRAVDLEINFTERGPDLKSKRNKGRCFDSTDSSYREERLFGENSVRCKSP